MLIDARARFSSGPCLLRISERDRECSATRKFAEALQLCIQRLLGERPARTLQLGVRSEHTCDERRPPRSIQRSNPLCAVIDFDTLAVLTVAGVIVMFDRVESRALALLGQVGGSRGVPTERAAEIADEIPVCQRADEQFIAAGSGQLHDGARLHCLLLIPALLRAHVVALRRYGEICRVL